MNNRKYLELTFLSVMLLFIFYLVSFLDGGIYNRSMGIFELSIGILPALLFYLAYVYEQSIFGKIGKWFGDIVYKQQEGSKFWNVILTYNKKLFEVIFGKITK